MGVSISVNGNNFATDVLQKSHEKPVLIDFFAQWCGPCQMLKPILEKLAQEYDFVLAKVDIDENPDLASTYRVEGVPDVKVAIEGEVQDGFVGVLPEPRLREFLAQLNLRSTLDKALEVIYDQAATGNLEKATALLEELLRRYPDNYPLLLEGANFYLEAGDLERAETLLFSIPPYEKETTARANGLRALIQFRQVINEPTTNHDLDPPFRAAAQAALEQNYTAALEGFLAIVSRDRRYRDDGARKAMLALFELLGNEEPLTKEYRKRLMQTLY